MKEKAWEEEQRAKETRTNETEKEQAQGKLSCLVDSLTFSHTDSISATVSDTPPNENKNESTPSVQSELSTPHLDEDDLDDTLPAPLPPLTQEALSSLSSSALSRPSSPTPSDSGSSTTSSTLTVSSKSSQIDQYIAEMLRRAQKLGEHVEKMEIQEANPLKPLQSVAVA
jgi:hypothetical protein